MSSYHHSLSLVLFYQKEYDAAIRHAKDAMSLGGPRSRGEQVIGQSLFGKVNAQWLVMDLTEREKRLLEAREHLVRSLIVPAVYPYESDHNTRAEQTIAKVDERLEILKQQALARAKPQ